MSSQAETVSHYGLFAAQQRDRAGVSVLYTCSCRRQHPVERLFFCSDVGCMHLVCEDCSLTELDTHYCGHCLTDVLSTTAAQNGGRCQQCFECPACQHTLQMVIDSDKKYSFACDFCKWQSKSIALAADKSKALFLMASDLAKDSDGDTAYAKTLSAHQARLRAERERRRNLAYGMEMEELEARPRLRNVDLSKALEQIERQREEKVRAAYKIPEADADNAAVLAKADRDADPSVRLTTFAQRNAIPGRDATRERALVPRRKRLMVKTAHRCNKCKKYVVKPKIGITVAFDSTTCAISFVPRITVSRIAPGEFRRDRPTTVVLYFRNPVHAEVDVELAEIKDPSPPHKPPHSVEQSCDVVLPAGPITMAAFDELQQQEVYDLGKTPKPAAYKDPAGAVALRFLNKVGINCTVTPVGDAADDVRFAMRVKLTSHLQTASEYKTLEFRVDVCLGKTDDGV